MRVAGFDFEVLPGQRGPGKGVHPSWGVAYKV